MPEKFGKAGRHRLLGLAIVAGVQDMRVGGGPGPSQTDIDIGSGVGLSESNSASSACRRFVSCFDLSFEPVETPMDGAIHIAAGKRDELLLPRRSLGFRR